jgi:serine/threonine protein phosphatase PrpC
MVERVVRGVVTSATAQGMRSAQEDRYAVVDIANRGLVLAVFDGHNGAATAHAAALLLPDAFQRSLDLYGDARAAVEAAIGIIREETSDREEGSSVSLVFIDESKGRATVGVLGDSPVLVLERDGRTVLGPLHNTMVNPDDAERAVARGALLMGPYLMDPRTLEGVNLTRTIGDAAFGFLGRTPETLGVDIGPQSYVLVATDGLFSPEAPNPEALVRRLDRLVSEGADARALVDDAIESGSDDNVTVVLWRAEA